MNAQGEVTSFTADIRGLYRVILEADVSSSAGTQTVEKRTLFSFADAGTETFESGLLRLSRPYFWETDAENPWGITSAIANSGSFAVASPDIKHEESTSLSVTFTQAVDAPFMFSFKLSTEQDYDIFTVLIDGVTQAALSGEIDWAGLWIPLLAGEHTVTWIYEKDDSFSEGADLVWVDDVFFPETAVFTSIESNSTSGLPDVFSLLQNYPNPFNTRTTITYSLPEAEFVSLSIFDALGREVSRLVSDTQPAGRYQIPFDASHFANGIYYYELKAGAFQERRAMILSK